MDFNEWEVEKKDRNYLCIIFAKGMSWECFDFVKK